MARFDWERAAKEDYIRRHGSLPFWVGLAKDDLEDAVVQKQADLQRRLAAVLDVVAEFARLTPFERRRQYELYFRRICRRFDEERARLARPSLAESDAIDNYERGTLALLKGVLPADSAETASTPK
jgi:hypothetical protein